MNRQVALQSGHFVKIPVISRTCKKASTGAGSLEREIIKYYGPTLRNTEIAHEKSIGCAYFGANLGGELTNLGYDSAGRLLVQTNYPDAGISHIYVDIGEYGCLLFRSFGCFRWR